VRRRRADRSCRGDEAGLHSAIVPRPSSSSLPALQLRRLAADVAQRGAEVSEGPACPKQPGRARGRVGSDSARRGEGAMRRRGRPPPLALLTRHTARPCPTSPRRARPGSSRRSPASRSRTRCALSLTLTSRASFPAHAGPAPRWPATASQQQQADLYLRSHSLHRLAADVRPRGARGARARRRRDPRQDRLLLQRPGPAVRSDSLAASPHHHEEPADAELAAAPGSRTRSSRCVLVSIRTSSARSSLTSSTKSGASVWTVSA